MEATHFIEVYKKLGITYYSDVKAIESLKIELFLSDFDVYTKTIAVWRIKPTDVPLQTRMDLRKWGMGYGQVDDGEIYKTDISQYKYLRIKLENINIPTL